MTLPTLADFIATALEDCDSIQEMPAGSNRTRYGDEREAHYPLMVTLDNGTPFPLTWGTDWCGISAGHSYAEAAGWPSVWPLPIQSFYCPSDVARWRAIGRWHATPELGDFIYFSWNRNGNADHVGIVVGIRGQWLDVVEGNVGSPSIWRRKSSYSWGAGSQVLGFGRPEFAPATPPLPPPPKEDDMIRLRRLQPFDAVVTLALGAHLTNAEATALLGVGGATWPTDAPLVSPFHAPAIASMLHHAGEDGSSLRVYPGESLTDPQRAELAALGVIVP